MIRQFRASHLALVRLNATRRHFSKSSNNIRQGVRIGGNPGSQSKSSSSSVPPYVWAAVGLPTGLTIFLYFRYLDSVPLTNRSRWIATSPEWEVKLGDQEAVKLQKQFQGKILPPDHRASVTVHRIGARLAEAGAEFCREFGVDKKTEKSHSNSDLTATLPLKYTIVRSDTANAFVLPNNHVFVMTGLFKYATNEDELAAVLAHEMAHTLARHVGEKVSGGFVSTVLAQLSLLIDPSGALLSIMLPVRSLLRDLPHSRTQETEADHIGLYLAAKACFDPHAAPNVFRRMEEDAKGQPPEFLSTHPAHASRIEQFGKWMPEAEKIYRGIDGSRCRVIRDEMRAAREIAARRALERERAPKI